MTGSRDALEVLTTGDAARALGITRQAVHLRVKSGTIVPLARTRAGYLFDPSEVDRVRAERQNSRKGSNS